jgi:acetyltransferase-like isoleucine patch superfamily enzyme
MISYGTNSLGPGIQCFEPVTLGFPSREQLGKSNFPGVCMGENAILRSGTIIYCEVTIGNHFQCGHNVLIREKTRIGNNVAIGSSTIIEGYSTIGDDVRVQSMVFIPTHTEIGNGVFIGPHAVLTNDRYPPTGTPELKGPVVGDRVIIGASAVILPGIRLGPGSAVAAGAVVTRDIPAEKMAIGSPARIREMPEAMVRS